MTYPADRSDYPCAALVIAGPTASGKTALALELAAHYGTEIISADSMQCYRGMEIGTAAPTPAECACIPHHLVACLDPDETMSAGRFQQEARTVIANLNAQGLPAVIVGGSGLYLQALVDGLFSGPGRDPAIRRRLRDKAAAEGNAALFAQLQAVDPDYAASLSSPNDLVRIIRALEVYELSGEPFSVLHRRHQAAIRPIPARWFALKHPRDGLYQRIDRRVLQMIEAGWLAEVQRLLDTGHRDALYRIKALGYREICAYLDGDQPLDEAIAATQKHHRRLAKRQLSWFRGEKRIQWLHVNDATPTCASLDGILRGLEG